MFDCFSGSGDCLAFENCETLSDGCEDCFSSEVTCDRVPDCEVAGFCHGILLQFFNAASYAICLKECKVTDGCAWFTFDAEFGKCFLLRECERIDPCETCLSGEAGCLVDYGYETKLVVAGGDGTPIDDPAKSVEVIDLADPENECDPLPDLPFGGSGSRAGSARAN